MVIDSWEYSLHRGVEKAPLCNYNTPVDWSNLSGGGKEDAMNTQIGEAAGQIWRYLAEHGEVSLRQLQRGTRLPDRLLPMGVGWLAREDQLRLVQERGVVKLSLHTASAPR